MKSSCLMMLVLMAAVGEALADPPPDNFLGIKWGAPAAEVLKAMSSRPGIAVQSSRPDVLRFTGGSFAGFAGDAWELQFGPRGFHTAVVIVHDPDSADSFKRMKMAITEKYGAGRSQAVGTRPPPAFDWIDQQWENQRASKPSPEMTWRLRTSFTSHEIFIRCSPLGGNRVRVVYRNETPENVPPSPTKQGVKPVKRDL